MLEPKKNSDVDSITSIRLHGSIDFKLVHSVTEN